LAGCISGRLGEFAVTRDSSQTVVTVQVNSTDAQFVADSGSFFNSISPQTATELHLTLASGPPTNVLAP
jgi:hypothetical protein